MRRRRKPRVVWLNPASENRIGGTAVAGFTPGTGEIILEGLVPTAGQSVTGLAPLFGDQSSGSSQIQGTTFNSLADIYSSGYRLRRIVGKIYCGIYQNPATLGDAPEILLTVGLIVLRVQDDGSPLLSSTPEQYNPQAIDQWADPWIWRRTWLFGNASEAIAGGLNIYPEQNTQYGDIQSGPHVDAKTARVLGREERVFLVANALATRASTGPGAFVAPIYWDLRAVASMRTNQGNRRNATR